MKKTDVKSAVEELHGLSSRELIKLLKDSENFAIQVNHENGSSFQIDMERLATFLPLHLIAVLLSGEHDVCLAHLLRGFRLLHSLCDLASRHTRLEQILLDEVKVSEQVLDLVFYSIILLGCYQKDYSRGTSLPVLHAALVACSLHLISGYISSQWHDIVHVLLAHPKVDIFMDVAFDAVHVDIKFLHFILLMVDADDHCKRNGLTITEGKIHYIIQQCEASVQYLMFLCQQKLFRDRLLKNKEMHRNGGILLLASAILKLNSPIRFKESADIVIGISRLKGKVLSILLQLCEEESISYLDEVAGSSESMDMAKSVALEILDQLKSYFKNRVKEEGNSCSKRNPRGLVLLNALRLADIFSDDSNFRSFFMINAIPALTEIFGVPHDQFMSCWCSMNVPDAEEDANLEYDPFTAAGLAFKYCHDDYQNLPSSPALLNETHPICSSSFYGLPAVTYAQHRTLCLVKIIANLHCFIPNICEEEEKNLFLKRFQHHMIAEMPKSSPATYDGSKSAQICENLGSLSSYAASLISTLLSNEDVQLLSTFSKHLLELFPATSGNKEPVAKEEKTADHKPLNACPSNALLSTGYHEGSQGPSGYAPSSLGKLDSRIDEEVRSITNDANVKPEVPETSNVHGASKLYTANSIKEDPDFISDSGEFFKIEEFVKDSNFQDDDMVDILQGEEKQQKKRKRNIMNETQINLIETALLDEPEMQRNASLLQSWADKLSSHGSDITASQLKNWVNNRKAKLARAARDGRSSEGENAGLEKSIGSTTSQLYDSAEIAGEEYDLFLSGSNNESTIPGTVGEADIMTSTNIPELTPHRCNTMRHQIVESTSFEPGQLVNLIDDGGNNIGTGTVFQVIGNWHGKLLDDRDICVVDITDLKTDKSKTVPHPSEAAGQTFDDAVARNGGMMRVAWDTVRLIRVASQAN